MDQKEINDYIMNNQHLLKHLTNNVYMRYTGTLLDFDDFLQETYVIVSKLLKSYKSNKSKVNTYIYNYLPKKLTQFSYFNSYSFKASYNDVMNLDKREKINQLKTISVEENIRFIEDKFFIENESAIEDKIKVDLIKKVLRENDIRNKEIFEQIYFNNMTYNEAGAKYGFTFNQIAREMNIIKNKIKVRLRRIGAM